MLHVNDLTYRLGPRTLFDKATVAIPLRRARGFVARNGTGKTTLFRIIRGEVSPEGRLGDDRAGPAQSARSRRKRPAGPRR